MKLNKKTRIIGLSIILVAIIAAGIGMVIFWQNGQGDKSGLDGKDPNTQDPQAQQLGYIQDGQIYKETLGGEQFFQRNNVLLGRIMRISDKIIMRTETEQGTVFVDVNSGESLCTAPPHWKDNEPSIGTAALDCDENIYNVYYSNELKTVVIEKNYKNNTKPYEIIPLSGFNGEIIVRESISFIYESKLLVDNNYLYLMTFPKDSKVSLQVFTHDGKLHAEYMNISDFDVGADGGLYTVQMNQVGSSLSKYDVSNKRVIFTALSEIGGGAFRCVSLEPGSQLVYVGTNEDVLIYSAADGKLIKTAMDILSTAPALAGYVQAIVADSEHNLYFPVLVQAESRQRHATVQIYKYTITEDLRKDMPYTLTITAPYRDEYMVEVIAQFERDNPNERIKYDYKYNGWMDFANNSDADGYFEKANLKLLTGDFGDIFMSGGAWQDTYQLYKNEIFADLTELIKGDPSYSQLDQNMLSAITVDGKLRGLPLAANYFYAQINTELASEMGINIDWSNAKWSDVLALLPHFEGTDKYLVSVYGDVERAFVRMLISQMPDLIDVEGKKVDLRQKWFLDLIEQWKTAVASPHFAQINERMGLKENSLICIDMRTERSYISDDISRTAKFYGDVSRSIGIAPLFAGEKNSNRTAASSDIYSIKAGGERADVAWKLLSTALRDDMQSKNSIINRPVNATARSQKTNANLYEGDSFGKAMRKAADEFEVVYSSVDYLYDMNKIKEDLFKPLLKYLDGTITIDEALKTAEHDIWIRLNE